MGTGIVGGTNAKPGAWPWQVTMDYKGHNKTQRCGGSIVAPQWIVSAAQCFSYDLDTNPDPDQYTIVAGNRCMMGNACPFMHITALYVFTLKTH